VRKEEKEKRRDFRTSAFAMPMARQGDTENIGRRSRNQKSFNHGKHRKHGKDKKEFLSAKFAD